MLRDIFMLARQLGEPSKARQGIEELGKEAIVTLYESMYCTVKSWATVTYIMKAKTNSACGLCAGGQIELPTRRNAH